MILPSASVSEIIAEVFTESICCENSVWWFLNSVMSFAIFTIFSSFPSKLNIGLYAPLIQTDSPFLFIRLKLPFKNSPLLSAFQKLRYSSLFAISGSKNRL